MRRGGRGEEEEREVRQGKKGERRDREIATGYMNPPLHLPTAFQQSSLLHYCSKEALYLC